MKKIIIFISLVLLVCFISSCNLSEAKEKTKGFMNETEEFFGDLTEPYDADPRINGIFVYSSDKVLKAYEFDREDSKEGSFYSYGNREGLKEIEVTYNIRGEVPHDNREKNIFRIFEYEKVKITEGINAGKFDYTYTDLEIDLKYNEKDKSLTASYMTSNNGFKDEVFKKSTKKEYNKLLELLKNK